MCNQHVISIIIFCLSKSIEFLSQGTSCTQNGNGHKCLPAIDRADKIIHGSSEVLVLQLHETNELLANNMPQNHR